MQRIAFSLITLLVATLACSDSKKPTPGTPCLMNSECNNPLSCTFGKCHETCREARDCPTGQLCARAVGGNVCVLPEEERCALNSQCPAPLVCGSDGRCRNQCEADRDCATATQKCVEKVCAEPIDVTLDGGLRPADGGVPGTSDAATDTGASDSPVVADTGTPSGGDPCTGAVESVPNNTRETATPITIGTPFNACLQNADDNDFYQFTVPATPAAGGLVKVQVTDVGVNSNIYIYAFAANDNGMIESHYAVDKGASVHLYFAAQAGATFRVDIKEFAGGVPAPNPYRLTVLYTPTPDSHEPNQDVASATAITVATPVMGTFFAGHLDSTAPGAPAWEDRYKVMLAPGEVTIALTNVASDSNAAMVLLDPLGSQITNKYDPTEGSSVVLKHTITAEDAGLCQLVIKPFTTQTTHGRGSTVPVFYTQPYQLLVTQP